MTPGPTLPGPTRRRRRSSRRRDAAIREARGGVRRRARGRRAATPPPRPTRCCRAPADARPRVQAVARRAACVAHYPFEETSPDSRRQAADARVPRRAAVAAAAGARNQRAHRVRPPPAAPGRRRRAGAPLPAERRPAAGGRARAPRRCRRTWCATRWCSRRATTPARRPAFLEAPILRDGVEGQGVLLRRHQPRRPRARTSATSSARSRSASTSG